WRPWARGTVALEFPARLRVPEPHRPIVTPREDAAPVGRKPHRLDLTGVPGKRPNLLSRLHLPQARRPIQAGGQDISAVGGEDRAPNALCVSLEAAQLLPFIQVPQAHHAFPLVAARGDGVAPFEGTGHTPEPFLVVEAAHLFPFLDVPYPND